MNYNDRIQLIKNAVNKVQNNDSDNELDFNDSDDLIELELLEEDAINGQQTIDWWFISDI